MAGGAWRGRGGNGGIELRVIHCFQPPFVIPVQSTTYMEEVSPATLISGEMPKPTPGKRHVGPILRVSVSTARTVEVIVPGWDGCGGGLPVKLRVRSWR